MFSEHPLAQAIVEKSSVEGFEPHKIQHFESLIGNGAKSTCITCGDTDVYVGKLDLLKENHVISKEIENTVFRLSEEGKTTVVVSCGNEIKGVIGLTDEIKADSPEAIKEIKELGVEPVMLTGDNKKAGEFVASQVGINSVFAELLPEDKVKSIRTLLSEYDSVAMVGDGVNDAPALAESTVGIAMAAAGSDTAIEIANIALMNDKLSLIPYLIRLSRKTVKTIKRNTIGAISIKIIFILLAFLGYSNLVMAIAADVGVMLIVVLISLRLMSFK